MKTRAVQTLLLLVMLLAGSAIAGLAQSYTSDGKGSFSVNKEPKEIVKAVVSFTDRGRFVVSLEAADRTRFQFKGDYRGSAPRRGITIAEGPGRRDTSGVGNITLSDDKTFLRGIYISGKYGGDEYIVTFVVREREESSAESNSRFSMNDSVDAKGRLELGDKKREVQHVVINMMRGGDLTIRVSGRDMTDTTYKGRWAGSGTEYTVELRNVDRLEVKAKGTLRLGPRKLHFQRLEVEGKQDRDSFRLYAEPK